MESTDNDFIDMLGEQTRERATERDSGCTSRELLWVDIFLHTNSIIKANRAAEYAGNDRPDSKALKRELIKRQSILINRSVMSLEEILLTYSAIARFDPRKLFVDGKPIPIEELSDEAALAICGVDVQQLGKDKEWATVLKYKTESRLHALDSLCKVLGYTEGKKPGGGEAGVAGESITMNEKARRLAFYLQRVIEAEKQGLVLNA